MVAVSASAVSAQPAKTDPGTAAAPAASFAPPANDNFASATPIPAAGEYLSSTIEATPEPGEPVVSAACATSDSGQSVWFAFRSVDGTFVTLDTDGSVVAPPGAPGQFTDTILSVYTGSSLSTLTSIACNDDDPENTLPGDFTSALVDVPVTAGTTYYVRVSSFNASRRNGEARLTVVGNVSAPTAGEDGADALGSRLSVAPNPLVTAGTVSLTAGTAQDVRVALVDALGREVRVLLSRPMAAGQQAAVAVSTAGLPAGVYVVRATGAAMDLTRRVTVVR